MTYGDFLIYALLSGKISNAASSTQAEISTEYSSTSTYEKYDVVTHDGKVYIAKQDISTAEAWNSAHWNETTIGQLLSNLGKTLDTLSPDAETIILKSNESDKQFAIQVDDDGTIAATEITENNGGGGGGHGIWVP